MRNRIKNCIPRNARLGTRRLGLTSAVACALALSARGDAQVIAPNIPVKDQTLTAQSNVEPGAKFGKNGAMGKIGPLDDGADDFVVCAYNQTVGGLPGVGAAYAFQNDGLLIMGNQPILPPDYQWDPPDGHLGFGLSDVEIGNVRGTGFPNLVFIAAAHDDREAIFTVGAVDVYDMHLGSATFVMSIEPPLDAGVAYPPGCYVSTPARRFGHGFAIADVDGDGYKDLVVGASDTTEASGAQDCSRVAHGRVYVFFGHPHFTDLHYPGGAGPPGYLYRCLAIKAPQVVPNHDQFMAGGEFGLSVDADDLDGDAKAEILAGRGERDLDRGRAHLFYGSWIATQLPTGLWPTGAALVITPPAAEFKNVGVAGAYQTLIDTTDDPHGSDHTTFGFQVWMLRRDVGPSGITYPDGKKDIAITSNSAIWYGPTKTLDAGALWVFFNVSTGPGTPLVNPATGNLKLQTPVNGSDGPKQSARFGFVAATIDWASTGGPQATAPYLLVGEPKATVGPVGASLYGAGRVFIFSLPLDSTQGQGLLQSKLIVTEPVPQNGSQYGSCIAVGDYATDPSYPGQEFIIGAPFNDFDPVTGTCVPGTGTCLADLGRAYSYRGH